MDLTASLLAASNTPVPADAALEGMNIFPILERRTRPVERTLFWRITSGRQQRAVRSGDWKLIFDQGDPLLFDVRADLGERNDLIGRRPEVAKRLLSLLDKWEQDVDAEAKRSGR